MALNEAAPASLTLVNDVGSTVPCILTDDCLVTSVFFDFLHFTEILQCRLVSPVMGKLSKRLNLDAQARAKQLPVMRTGKQLSAFVDAFPLSRGLSAAPSSEWDLCHFKELGKVADIHLCITVNPATHLPNGLRYVQDALVSVDVGSPTKPFDINDVAAGCLNKCKIVSLYAGSSLTDVGVQKLIGARTLTINAASRVRGIGLAALPSLTRLTLSSCPGLTELPRMPNLVSLDLNSCGLIPSLDSVGPTLTHLLVSSSDLTHLRLVDCTSLQACTLANNTNTSDAVFADMPSCLQTMFLETGADPWLLTDESALSFRHIRELTYRPAGTPPIQHRRRAI